MLFLSRYRESHDATELLADVPEYFGSLLKDWVSNTAVLVDARRCWSTPGNG